MNILKEDFLIHDIDAHSLRGEHFYQSIIDFQKKILATQKHRIRKAEQFQCTLCKGITGKLFLEWQAGYQLFQCQQCGTVSPNIIMEDEKSHIETVYDTDEYYEKIMREIDKQYEYRKKIFGEDRYKYIFERLELNPSESKLLDLGCGAGYFLSTLKDKHIDYKGLEVTPHLVRYCQEKGLNVESTDLSDEKDELYDVITMFDVLEHLSDPISLLNTINTKIKPGGFCIAFTPNIHSVGYELMEGKQNTLLPFEHLCFFNKQSLEYLSKETGFEIHSIETFGLDIMDYLLLKEYEDGIAYTKKLHELMILLQGIVDKTKMSNHFRITFKKVSK